MSINIMKGGCRRVLLWCTAPPQPHANRYQATKHQQVASISFSSKLYDSYYHIMRRTVSLSESEDVEVGEYLTRVSKQRPGSNNPKLSDESRQLFSRQKFAKCRGFFVCVEKDKNSPAGFWRILPVRPLHTCLTCATGKVRVCTAAALPGK